jgi:hypothetical protein
LEEEEAQDPTVSTRQENNMLKGYDDDRIRQTAPHHIYLA